MSEERKARRGSRCHTVYQITYHAEDTPSGIVQEWFTTWTKAMRRLRRLGLQDSKTVNVVEVPRGKTSLVQWLNVHAEVG